MTSFQDGSAAAPAYEEAAETQPSASDHDLMGRVGRGDRDAFALLCGRHLRSCAAVAQRILGNAAEADEIAQESLFRLWGYAGRWDPNGTGSVRAWLSRVATNLCLDVLRKRRTASLDEAEKVEDPAPGPFETLGEADRRVLVQKLLMDLPERQRIAIVYAYFEEMSGQEIAAAMAISVGAVESLLVRGREGLRRAMGERGISWEKDL